MKKSISLNRKTLSLFSFAFLLSFMLMIQSCEKPADQPTANETATADPTMKKGNPHNQPPPLPPPFYFSNCYPGGNAVSATLVKGVAANIAISKTYINSPSAASYGAFTSATVNGITVTAPAGTFNVGTGTVTFTATGTPLATGIFSIAIYVGNIQPCQMYLQVINAPVTGPTVDPGATPGSTGVVQFTYRNLTVSYQTVRAKDGKIWLQQNLGSPQVAYSVSDQYSYGHYFQWGRWDDGHQLPNSSVISGGPSLSNPSHIAGGNPNYISGWWDTGGLATDTWSGTTPTSTNGKDPCTALGAGWHMPSNADWTNLKNYEDLEGALTAYMSNLKLPASGFRGFPNGESYYWSATAANTYANVLFISDNTYSATLQASYRSQGNTCRCVKN
jgi:uncharacterized protein (TIGR02145 family)